MLRQTVLYVMIFCMMIPQIVYARGQSSTQIEIITDHSRQIVFEQIGGEDTFTSSVDKKGYQELSFDEPGTYEYRIYESASSANRDTTEYIATVCVLVDEATGDLKDPIVAIDYADSSGKPEEIKFGNFVKPTPERPTERTTSTTSTRNRSNTPRKTENRNRSNIPFVQTGDTPLLMLYMGLFLLSVTGFILTAKRKNNEEP